MPEAELTVPMITAAMDKVDARVCVGSDRCFALPSDVETGRARCTADGRCRIGLSVSRGGRESFDVYGRASRMRLKGVAVARRKRVNPPASTTSRKRASPACAPSPRPTSWLSEAGVHSIVEAA
jgi:hypothetical protein